MINASLTSAVMETKSSKLLILIKWPEMASSSKTPPSPQPSALLAAFLTSSANTSAVTVLTSTLAPRSLCQLGPIAIPSSSAKAATSLDYWYAGHKQLGFYPKEKHKIFSTAKSNTQTEIIGEAASEFLGSEEPSYLGGAEQFLANRPKDQPFCLSICLNVPHNAGTGSMKMLPEDDELYRSAYRDQIDTLPLPDNYLAKVQVGTKEQPSKLPADLLFTEFRQDSYDWVNTHASARERIIRHYQTITGIDNMVGKIREQLAALEIADNTVIYFTSDHGLLAGEHGLGGKALNYQTCLSVPLIVCDPRVPDYAKGHRKKELVQSIDLAPTILDQAGLGKNPHMQGQSYRNFIRGKSAYWRTYAFSENLWSTYFGNPRIESIRGSRWKYIRYFKNDRTRWKDVKDSKEANAYTASAEDHKLYASWRTATFGEKAEKPVYEELYDLENDPGETTNLIKDSQHSRILTSLREKCQAGAEKARGPLDAQPPVKLN